MTPGGKGARPCRQTPHSKDDIIQALEATRPGKAELGMRRARFNATASGAHLHLETPLGFAWGRFTFWCDKPVVNVIREMTDTPSGNAIMSACHRKARKSSRGGCFARGMTDVGGGRPTVVTALGVSSVPSRVAPLSQRPLRTARDCGQGRS